MITTYLKEMNKTYDYILSKSEIAINPHLDKDKPYREQLVNCPCGCQYIVWVNGTTPISDFVMLDVVCPWCDLPASKYLMLSGHSAGCFNATIFGDKP